MTQSSVSRLLLNLCGAVTDRNTAYVSSSGSCFPVEEVMPGTIDTCACFTKVGAYDYDYGEGGDYIFITRSPIAVLIVFDRYLLQFPR
jgi:hypothetical protein